MSAIRKRPPNGSKFCSFLFWHIDILSLVFTTPAPQEIYVPPNGVSGASQLPS